MKSVILVICLVLNLYAEVGMISIVKGNVKITRDNQTIQITNGFKIEIKDVVLTGQNGSTQIAFKDGTVITIGANTVFNINEYFYEDANKNSQSSFSVTQGLFKVITGKIGKLNPKNFKLTTKTSNIGIRGTNFRGLVPSSIDGDEKLICTSGAIVVSSLHSSIPAVVVPAGFMTIVSPNKIEPPKIYTNHDLKEIEQPILVKETTVSKEVEVNPSEEKAALTSSEPQASTNASGEPTTQETNGNLQTNENKSLANDATVSQSMTSETISNLSVPIQNDTSLISTENIPQTQSQTNASNTAQVIAPTASSINETTKNIIKAIPLSGQIVLKDSTSFELQGLTAINSTLQIMKDNTIVGSTQANSMGEWSFRFALNDAFTEDASYKLNIIDENNGILTFEVSFKNLIISAIKKDYTYYNTLLNDQKLNVDYQIAALQSNMNAYKLFTPAVQSNIFDRQIMRANIGEYLNTTESDITNQSLVNQKFILSYNIDRFSDFLNLNAPNPSIVLQEFLVDMQSIAAIAQLKNYFNSRDTSVVNDDTRTSAYVRMALIKSEPWYFTKIDKDNLTLEMKIFIITQSEDSLYAINNEKLSDDYERIFQGSSMEIQAKLLKNIYFNRNEGITLFNSLSTEAKLGIVRLLPELIALENNYQVFFNAIPSLDVAALLTQTNSEKWGEAQKIKVLDVLNPQNRNALFLDSTINQADYMVGGMYYNRADIWNSRENLGSDTFLISAITSESPAQLVLYNYIPNQISSPIVATQQLPQSGISIYQSIVNNPLLFSGHTLFVNNENANVVSNHRLIIPNSFGGYYYADDLISGTINSTKTVEGSRFRTDWKFNPNSYLDGTNFFGQDANNMLYYVQQDVLTNNTNSVFNGFNVMQKVDSLATSNIGNSVNTIQANEAIQKTFYNHFNGAYTTLNSIPIVNFDFDNSGALDVHNSNTEELSLEYSFNTVQHASYVNEDIYNVVGSGIIDGSSGAIAIASMPDRVVDGALKTVDDFSSWGYWMAQSDVTAPNLKGIGGYFVRGNLTPMEYIANLNNTTYTYHGHIAGDVYKPSEGWSTHQPMYPILLNANNSFKASINFGASNPVVIEEFKFDTVGSQGGNFTQNMQINTSSISGNSFSANATNASLEGNFFGTQAQSIGGKVQGSLSDTLMINGVFKATKVE